MMSRLIFRLLVATFFFTLFACPVSAQIGRAAGSASVQLHGQVRYSRGGTPAYNILVRLDRFDGGSVGQEYTDRNGRFRFTSLRPLTYILTIHTAGFEDVQEQVELVTKNSEYVILSLRPDPSVSPETASLGPAVVLDVKTPVNARKEYEKGRAALLEGSKPQEGIAHLEKAIALYPNFLEAYLMLGTAYLDTQQLDKAQSVLRRAIEINPKRPEAYFALGEVHRQQKKYIEAEKVITDGLKLQERSWQAHYTLGRVYYETDNLLKAGRHVAKVLQLKPDLAEAHLLGANILLRYRKTEDALTEFQEYLRLDPNGRFAPQAREAVAKIKKAMAENKKK